MILGLPPILGLLPLLLYIVLSFRKNVHPFVNVVICVLVGAILVGQPLLELGGVLGKSLGSFLGLVGLIIMLGSGLAFILHSTGVAENIVYILMRKIGVNTENRAILATMITSMTMSLLLGTLTGGNAVIAPIVVPLVAAVGITPSTLAVVLQAAGVTGLFIGPYTPPMVTLMGITNLSYLDILFHISLPLSALMWVLVFLFAKRTQKLTKGVYSYGSDVERPRDDYVPTKETARATKALLITMVLLVIYGIVMKGGASFAVMVMIVSALVTGLAAGYGITRIYEEIMAGCAKFLWLFLMFVLFDPFLMFVEKSGAFGALVEYAQPFINSGGMMGVALIATAIGTWGINGAAVAQAMMMDKLFRPVVDSLGMSPYLWGLIVLLGSQLTSFAYPGLDIIAAMGMARSTDMKTMLKFGYILIVAAFLLCAGCVYVYAG